MSDLHELSAADQLRALRAGDVSSRDLVEHYLARIERLDPELGAFVTVTGERALDEAARADARLAAGEWTPLCGLPIGIKDLYATAGIRTTFGSAAMTDNVPTEDTWTVQLLRQAGAVVLGKTNTPEFGATCFTENDVTARPAVTPYGMACYSSGSSGGAAAAVAAGLLPVAHASDSAGSIRTPAATCHLVGVKPSRGLVSPAPATAFFNAGTEGPIARTVADAALLLDVMGHPWPGDLYGWRPGTTFTDTLAQPPPRRLKIATWTATGLQGIDPHPEAIVATRRAADALRELGHDVHEVSIPATYDVSMQRAIDVWFASSVATATTTMIPAQRRTLLAPYSRYLHAGGEALSGVDVTLAHSVLARYASTFLDALADFDAVVTPSTNGPPVPIGHYLEQGVEGVADRMLRWSCYTPWANLAGAPAVALPSLVNADGLPLGVQLVGRPRQDTALLRLAAQLEEAGLWAEIHPPCWND